MNNGFSHLNGLKQHMYGLKNEVLIRVYLSLLLRQLHVVKDPENDSEQILPPVFLKGVPVGLHHFKHHCETPGTRAHRHTHKSMNLTVTLTV